MEFEIKKTEKDTILVFTPYNGDFVKKVKSLGNAKWNSGKKAWEMPSFLEDEVKKIISDVYGYEEDGAGNTVDVKVIIKETIEVYRGDVTLLGKCLCHASGRDSGGRCSTDVAYLKGKASSGGSVKNWRSVVPTGSEILLHNVSEKKYNELINSDNDILKSIELFLVEKPKSTAKEELKAEKEKLLKRIEEIDKFLQEEEKNLHEKL